MVTGMLASMASDWDKSISDLLRIRHLPAVEFSADSAIWSFCDVRFRYGRDSRPVPISMAGEHVVAPQEVESRSGTLTSSIGYKQRSGSSMSRTHKTPCHTLRNHW